MIILEYLNNRGISPFGKWYRKLDETIKIKIDARLQRIKILDNLGDYKQLNPGLFELRFRSSSGIRIYYGRKGSNFIILLAGGNKSSQERDIKKARSYWFDYLKQGSKNDKSK